MSYSKYNAIPKIVDDIKFDSTVEADFYIHLKEELKRKRIKMFKPHQPFVILEGYQISDFEIEGTKISRRKASATKYIADFVVTYNNNFVAVIDVKGGLTTDVFKLKKKMFELQYGIPIVEARKRDGQWIYS